MTRPSDSQLRSALSALLDRVATTLDETGERFPYVYDRERGAWETTADGNWCGGHWIGLLWLAAANADGAERDRFEEAARSHTVTMRASMPRDSMFCGMNFRYAGFRGYETTGDRTLFGVGLAGADAMVDAYDESARQIPLGTLAIRGPEQFRGPESEHGPPGDRIGAVDNVYTAVPVLWRAYRETNDPRFRDVAVSHTDRHLDWYLRDDGRTWHHAVFDSSGALDRQYNELAHSDESCWARGQGWSIAGLAAAYRETRAERYRRGLAANVTYYRDHAPDDLVPHWDFEVEDETEPRDTSAAALTAYGLTRLPADDERVTELRTFGHAILSSLLSSYLVTDEDADGDDDERAWTYGQVTHGCFNRPGKYAVDTELIWTTYYLAYTLATLLDGRW